MTEKTTTSETVEFRIMGSYRNTADGSIQETPVAVGVSGRDIGRRLANAKQMIGQETERGILLARLWVEKRVVKIVATTTWSDWEKAEA